MIKIGKELKSYWNHKSTGSCEWIGIWSVNKEKYPNKLLLAQDFKAIDTIYNGYFNSISDHGSPSRVILDNIEFHNLIFWSLSAPGSSLLFYAIGYLDEQK